MSKRKTHPYCGRLVLAVALVSCQSSRPPCHEGGSPFSPALAAPYCLGEGKPYFVDRTRVSGTGQVHAIPNPGLPYYPLNIGGGAVLEDLDGDRDLDLYVTNANGPKALYLNHGDGTFDECAEHAGVAFPDDWTNGVSAADYDNDGDQDLYLLNRGANRLLRNAGDGTFEDITTEAGVGDEGVGASASWADLDGDGWLDLFVANLATAFDPLAADPIDPGTSTLYRGLGNGRFEDISNTIPPDGLPPGSSYVGALADLDRDRKPDLFFTQEFGESLFGNRLYRNLGVQDGVITWQDVSRDSGAESPYAAMGVAVLDSNGDALPDLFVSNLWGSPPQREALLLNQGNLRFVDESVATLAFAMSEKPKLPRTVSWGTLAFDLENDGDEDLYITYGHFVPSYDFAFNGSAYPPMRTGQPNALLQNTGSGNFHLLHGSCAEEAGRGRGSVVGDVDGDGCLDLYVVNQNGSARLLRNLCEDSGHVLVLQLVGTHINRDAIGSEVTVTSGTHAQTKWVLGGVASVHSAIPKRLHFGLGIATSANVRIVWADGTEQSLSDVPAGPALREIVQP